MTEIRGVYTALVTPFDSEDRLDEQGLRKNIQFQLHHGVDGLVLLGTTGESPTLSEQEKTRIIQIAQEEVQGRMPLAVGTGSYSTKQTIQNTLRAEELGADIALVVTPYYNKPTQEGIYQHFHAVAAATNLPIILYNIPGRCGSNIAPATMERLAKIPNIVCVKETAGSVSQIAEIIETIPFSVMSGDDPFTLPLIALGGHGIISVASNLVPSEMKKLVDAALSGDFSQARTIHYQLLPLFRMLSIETNPIPIKTAMDIRGMAAGKCRLPLSELLPENQKKMETLLHGQKELQLL